MGMFARRRNVTSTAAAKVETVGAYHLAKNLEISVESQLEQ